jgi:hypothetical protein
MTAFCIWMAWSNCSKRVLAWLSKIKGKLQMKNSLLKEKTKTNVSKREV